MHECDRLRDVNKNRHMKCVSSAKQGHNDCMRQDSKDKHEKSVKDLRITKLTTQNDVLVQ